MPESTLLAALGHGSATSRVLNLVAAGRSVASFIEVAVDVVGKDVPLVRGIAEEPGSGLGAPDEAIETLDIAKRV